MRTRRYFPWAYARSPGELVWRESSSQLVWNLLLFELISRQPRPLTDKGAWFSGPRQNKVIRSWMGYMYENVVAMMLRFNCEQWLKLVGDRARNPGMLIKLASSSSFSLCLMNRWEISPSNQYMWEWQILETTSVKQWKPNEHFPSGFQADVLQPSIFNSNVKSQDKNLLSLWRSRIVVHASQRSPLSPLLFQWDFASSSRQECFHSMSKSSWNPSAIPSLKRDLTDLWTQSHENLLNK